ncbi:MAG: hypothetical protein ABSA50_05740 [Candidatus Bathyarchaeia archaeon]
MNPERVTIDDLRKIMKLMTVRFDENRLDLVTAALNQALEMLQPLAKLLLPKELEPTTYLARIKDAGRVARSENI